MKPLIRPRTDDERKAYMQGYIDCFNDIRESGMEAARQHIIVMGEAEGMIEERQNPEVKRRDVFDIFRSDEAMRAFGVERPERDT